MRRLTCRVTVLVAALCGIAAISASAASAAPPRRLESTARIAALGQKQATLGGQISTFSTPLPNLAARDPLQAIETFRALAVAQVHDGRYYVVNDALQAHIASSGKLARDTEKLARRLCAVLGICGALAHPLAQGVADIGGDPIVRGAIELVDDFGEVERALSEIEKAQAAKRKKKMKRESEEAQQKAKEHKSDLSLVVSAASDVLESLNAAGNWCAGDDVCEVLGAL